MFTGIIETLGRIERIEVSTSGHGRVMRIATPIASELKLGESISINGVCLTVTAADASGFNIEVSPETLRVTSLGALTVGAPVNLGRALRADARLGGHFVLGHVDGVGRITASVLEGAFTSLEVECPAAVVRYLIPKGSIAIDGISLTIAQLTGSRVRIQLVPYTLSHTTLGVSRVGDVVNVEADVLGKYVAGLLGNSGVLTDAARLMEHLR